MWRVEARTEAPADPNREGTTGHFSRLSITVSPYKQSPPHGAPAYRKTPRLMRTQMPPDQLIKTPVSSPR